MPTPGSKVDTAKSDEFRFQGRGSRVQGSGCRVQGVELRIWNLGSTLYGCGC